MPNSLRLQQSQRMALTPQLQQAIEILGASAAELTEEIHRAVDENPFLELKEQQGDPVSPEHALPEVSPWKGSEPGETAEGGPENSDNAFPGTPGASGAEHENFQELDFGNRSWGTPGGEGETTPIDWASGEETLQEHLAGQVPYLRADEQAKCRVMLLIGDLDEDGFLETPLEELAALGAVEGTGGTPSEWREAQVLLQSLDPAGTGVYSMQESLAAQLALLEAEAPDSERRLYRLAERAVREFLPELARRNLPKLRKALVCSSEELERMFPLIRALNPHPASNYKTETVEYAVPDILVVRRDGEWRAILNPAAAPAVALNDEMAGFPEPRRKGPPEEAAWAGKLSEAKNFIRSVEQRYRTILRVAQCIVGRQQRFFTQGEQGLEPMVLRDIATDTGLHESTVSRATSGKYLQAPSGIFELKHFFSSHVSSGTGAEVSSRAVRALIRELVSAEPDGKPLSDSKLSALLQERGYNVARRTVAKYREQEKILPASLRKRLSKKSC